jgi:hypothetical protein
MVVRELREAQLGKHMILLHVGPERVAESRDMKTMNV